jgi:adenosine deaminase
MTDLSNLVKKLPKAELHVHIEGTLEPELLIKLAQKNKIDIPYQSVSEIKQAYQFRNLEGFLELYYQGMNVLRNQTDFYLLTIAYFERVAQDNVRHVELFFDPQAHVSRGVPFSDVIEGILQGIEEARARLNITSKLILCFVRHLSEDSAFEMLNMALPYRNYITAVGLDSAEKDNPPRNFERVFTKARLEGFLIVAHAGEEGPADYVKQAVDLLKARRIDHGVRCAEDPELVKKLVALKIPLTVCPLSNVKLKVFSKITDHNIRALFESGLLVTINSDDPAYFGGYINDNFMQLVDHLRFQAPEIIQLCKNSFMASFLDSGTKEEYLKLIDETVKELMAGEPA